MYYETGSEISKKDIYLDISKNAANDLEDSNGALIIPLYKNNIVLTFHPKKRGWEFPTGKKGEQETIIECAIRKAYEDAGAILKNPKPVGYYIILKNSKKEKMAILISDIERFEPKPRYSETDVVKIFDEITDEIIFSDILFNLILEKLDF